MRHCDSSYFIIFFKVPLAILGSFSFHKNFRIILCIFTARNPAGILILIADNYSSICGKLTLLLFRIFQAMNIILFRFSLMFFTSVL